MSVSVYCLLPASCFHPNPILVLVNIALGGKGREWKLKLSSFTTWQLFTTGQLRWNLEIDIKKIWTFSVICLYFKDMIWFSFYKVLTDKIFILGKPFRSGSLCCRMVRAALSSRRARWRCPFWLVRACATLRVKYFWHHICAGILPDLKTTFWWWTML